MTYKIPTTLNRFGAVIAFALATSGFAGAGGHGGGYGGGHGGYGGGYGGHGGYGYGHGGYGYGYGVGFGYGFGYGYGWGYAPWYYPYYGYGAVDVPPVVILADGSSAPANLPADGIAHLTVTVPSSDAVVLVNGARTQQTEVVRRFQTTALTPGKDYAYEIQVRWTQDGKPVEQTRTVTVQAGARVNVDLTAPVEPVARLAVAAPTPDAEVWLNGARTDQTGLSRRFKSPELIPGRKYSYEVRARWMEDGKPQETTRTVVVEAGSQLNVDLTPGSATARK
jgi:uncharacterized protein (TIGR03000 family)